MAGIGFELERMSRVGGVGGVACAAIHGTVISSGPWLMTILAMSILQGWTSEQLSAGDRVGLQTIIIYAFSAAFVIAAPLAMATVRMVSDRIFLRQHDAVPNFLLGALTWAAVLSLLAGSLIFGLLASLPPAQTYLATAILVLLTQISIVGAILTATKRHGLILASYASGMICTALLIAIFPSSDPNMLLLPIACGLLLTLLPLTRAIALDFNPRPVWPQGSGADVRKVAYIGFTGLANASAVLVDKWLLWLAPGSIAALGVLRLNEINDSASFVGLTTTIPALALILIVSENRFETAFSRMLGGCTGTARLDRIEQARQALARVIMQDLRLLVTVQGAIALVCWVLAPEIFRLLDLDARGIFAFRLTVVGVVFHVMAIYVATALSYYDLFGRILMIWTTFILISATATILSWEIGFPGYGLGYLSGAVAAASLSLALLADSTLRLNYLLFVRNNPAVVGQRRYLA
jgi:uncharacterized membrane protein